VVRTQIRHVIALAENALVFWEGLAPELLATRKQSETSGLALSESKFPNNGEIAASMTYLRRDLVSAFALQLVPNL